MFVYECFDEDSETKTIDRKDLTLEIYMEYNRYGISERSMFVLLLLNTTNRKERDVFELKTLGKENGI